MLLCFGLLGSTQPAYANEIPSTELLQELERRLKGDAECVSDAGPRDAGRQAQGA